MDKIWFAISDMFAPTNPGQKFVTWNGTTWVLDEARWGTYCAEMANRGVNIFRWIGWSSWQKEHNLAPWVQLSTGDFNLTQPNETYWKIVDRMVEIANYPAQKPGIIAPGITIDLDLAFQYAHGEFGGLYHPFHRNVNGITSLYDEAAWPIFRDYALRWFAIVRNRKMVFGIGNELAEDSLDFTAKLLRLMDAERIFPFSWGIGPEIPMIENQLWKRSLRVILDEKLFSWWHLYWHPEWDCNIKRPFHHVGYPFNGVDVLEEVLENIGGNPPGKILSDDGCMGPEGKPGAIGWRVIIKRLLTWRGTDAVTIPWQEVEHPYVMIEHLPDDKPWDECREEQLGVVDAMADEASKYLGPFANTGQWPDARVEPKPPEPEPIPEPEPVKPPEPWYSWNRIRNVRRWTWRAWVWFSAIILLIIWLLK